MSTLTFNELTEQLLYVKVIWNHKVIYDDGTSEDLEQLKKEYGNKIVYKMLVIPVYGHHCIVKIKGE